VTGRALMETADKMASTGLVALGYDYILLDDGWPACAAGSTECGHGARIGDCGCTNPEPRLPNGDVLVDARKFPPSKPGLNDGIKVVADYLHTKGLKMGIYTAPHGLTCGGYWGMLGHEKTDAAMYAGWGIDFLKLDMGCRMDASIHDGTVRAWSLIRI
jgi:alpha-galactosidase